MPGQIAPRSPHSSLSLAQQWGPGGLPPFHFQTRREVMDWRRFSALDVDRVARELDVSTLQEHIGSVTFCDLDSERCPHCRNPVDPVLLKVLRMSQLSTEYLLHSQDYLSTQVALLEERLQGVIEERDQEQKEKARLAGELQTTQQESRRRKKMLATQQMLLQASTNNYHKCQLCDKSFMNYSYLQGHLQRRHPEITDAERQKKKQVEQMEDGIEDLRERLKRTQSKLEAEQEADAQRRLQEQKEQSQREAEEKMQFEKWKEEERKKFYLEIGDLRQLFLQEFKAVSSKSTALEMKLQELQTSGLPSSNLGALRDDDDQEDREAKEMELREKMKRQKHEWKKRMRELQGAHLQEKEELQSENERLRMSLSADQKSTVQRFQQQISLLGSKIKQKEKVIKTQEETINKLSSRTVTVTPVKQQDKESSSEEEEEEELLDTLDGKQRLLEALKRNPNLVKEFRPILQETLEEKLESMGLRKGATGIPKQTFNSLSSTVSTQRQQKAKRYQELLSLRESLSREVTRKLHKGSSAPTPAARRKAQSSQPRQSSSKPRAAQVTQPRLVQSNTPQPAPRTTVTSPASRAPATKTNNSTPPFSSEEESVGDSAYVTSPAAKDPPVVRVVKPGPLQPQAAVSDDDWSDTDLSEGPVSPAAGLRGSQGSVVQSLTRSLERQLSTPMKKPVGGVKVIPPYVSTSPKSSAIVKQLQLSDEESDLDLSSIEELTTVTSHHKEAAVRGSADSAGSSSVWSSAASRGGGW
ncbi:cilium assembly protein DZIP1L [Acipenser ruthenus]|uniref:cilium assembly protein DZIP1L n=1 Tax=Acipenser ruthenus TaxID=7906 RepID=UPI00145BE5C2|nr:cilium assembly protein DZIP1L [Acipenser ruthenus]XP_033895777.1 cilium assembly protein DZIP1L [Acipenser ruthenus]